LAERKRSRRSRFPVMLVFIGLLACVGVYGYGYLSGGSRTSIITSAVLADAVDIAELSTAEFRYRGIADVYKDEEKTDILCHICYSAVVKAGIDMSKVSFDVNYDEKTVAAHLPEIMITTNVVDENSMLVMPDNAKVDLAEMLTWCEQDAEAEALATGELMDAAEENLRTSIEGLLYPILEPKGYGLVWEA